MASEHDSNEPPIFGVSAEFASPAGLLAAVRRLSSRNFGRIEAYSPLPIPGMAEALGGAGSLTPVAAAGAIIGAGAMMAMCLYATVYNYVFDIGGRPLVSWPAFIVPSVSFGALVGALFICFTFLFVNRLPRLNHAAFNVPGFTRATVDRFFVVIEAPEDAPLDPSAVENALRDLVEKPITVAEVPR